MEKLDLTIPIVTSNVTSYKVIRLYLDFPAAYLRIDLMNSNNKELSFEYTGLTATTFMIALNKINLSIKSLQRRILERLITDGFLVGTISGLPD